jgi:hypothetical protein
MVAQVSVYVCWGRGSLRLSPAVLQAVRLTAQAKQCISVQAGHAGIHPG